MKYKQYVVIVGNMFGSKTIHGPFYTIEEAEAWIQAHRLLNGQHYEMEELRPAM